MAILESSIQEDGRVVKGVNTTVDVDTDEIAVQSAKFGNSVDADGVPPTITEDDGGEDSPVPKDMRPGLSGRYKALFSRKG